jgi:hypothetical protein
MVFPIENILFNFFNESKKKKRKKENILDESKT